MTLVAQSTLELFENELLIEDNLLSRVLVAICTRLSLFLRIENDRELGWLKRAVNELKSSIRQELVVVIFGRFLHQFPLLGRVGDDYNRRVAMNHRVEDLIHNADDFASLVKHQNNMSEEDGIVTANHALGLDHVGLSCDLMRNPSR